MKKSKTGAGNGKLRNLLKVIDKEIKQDRLAFLDAELEAQMKDTLQLIFGPPCPVYRMADYAHLRKVEVKKKPKLTLVQGTKETK
jgi:hypothetical protein